MLYTNSRQFGTSASDDQRTRAWVILFELS